MDSSGVSFVMCVFIACSMLVEVVGGKSNVHVIYLGGRQRTDGTEKELHRKLLTSVLGSNEKADEAIVYSYKWGFSGFAAKITEAQAQRLSELPEVIKVLPNTVHRMQTTRSWDFLGVPYLHAPSSSLNQSNLGDGVIIGILDTGIWPESRSFNDELLRPVPTRWRGSCDRGSESGSSNLCDKKIIGSRWYINGLLAEFGPPSNTSEFFSPRDAVGHGTRTASTAAGSVVSNVTFEGVGTGNAHGGATLA
ncbi:hypothetical protein MLD38_037253 [Melastoma candidum]|uniref:Uncharacterized protein n=1 Tax=Melastoma candidum TaxID=119954 RepID=A0ACB9LN95_9MYRT|nr:hypothetical protein MLD38_037253 [Melastoma candidum]